MKNIFKSVMIVCVMLALLTACKKNKTSDPNPTTPIEVGGGDEENITRVVLILNNGAFKDTVTYKDLKGDGSKITIDSLILKADATYLVEVKVYDDTKNPVMLVSEEIAKEANFHRFHYVLSSASVSPNIPVGILDQDTNSPPQPLGLLFNLFTGSKSEIGNFKISLRHFAEGVKKNADPAGGQQDILVNFPVRLYKF